MTASGAAAEDLAGAYLAAQGLQPVARNYRCRFGEIDLIVRDAETLVFVEVRLRASQRFGGARASIDGAKQRKLIAAASHYLSQHDSARPCRFDVILLDRLEPGRIEWIKDAFS